MGRWSHYIFGGDQDLDLLGMVEEDIIKAAGLDLPRDSRPDIDDKVAVEHLNNGVTKQLLTKYRTTPDEWFGEYQNIILAAHVMSLGADLDDEDKKYLRELIPKIPSRYGYQWAIGDDGFREPGRAQFQTALNQYKNGEKRDFQAPSCWTCGKTKAELGKHPLTCKGCGEAVYCNKECQKADWYRHKQLDKRAKAQNASGGIRMLNV